MTKRSPFRYFKTSIYLIFISLEDSPGKLAICGELIIGIPWLILDDLGTVAIIIEVQQGNRHPEMLRKEGEFPRRFGPAAECPYASW